MDAYVSVDASCCCTVTQSRPTLRNLMNCNKPGFSVLHYLLEFSQTQVHWLSDAIQPSYPLSSPSPPALNLFQHQGLFQWVDSLCQVAKVLELQQHPSNEYSELISFRIDWFDLLAVQRIHTCCSRGSYLTLSNSTSENLCEENDLDCLFANI